MIISVFKESNVGDMFLFSNGESQVPPNSFEALHKLILNGEIHGSIYHTPTGVNMMDGMCSSQEPVRRSCILIFN